MLTQHTVTDAARAAGLTAPAHFLPVTGSTNSDLLRLAEQGAPEWTLVAAGRQSSGRGRLGRAWFDAEGASLLFSVLLRPRMRAAHVPVLSLGAAAAMAQACAEACGVQVMCKWPNDLVVGGRKLAGVLAEGSVDAERISHIVIGVGVNVRQAAEDFPVEFRQGATSLALEGGSCDSAQLLTAHLRCFKKLYGVGGVGSGERVLPAYRRLCDTIGRTVRAVTVSGAAVEGTAVGVGDDGELLVETRLAVERVTFGQVQHLS